MLDFIEKKEHVEFTMQKWLYFTYPSFGLGLGQFCHDQLHWQKELISNWVSQHLPLETQPGENAPKIRAVVVNPSIQTSSWPLHALLQPLPALF
jgi:hypothetical protein